MRSNSSYFITPDAFSVHPALVGRPLARPARRLTAMLLDLLIVSILVHLAGALLLGLAAAWLAFRAAGRLPGTSARLPRVVGRVSFFATGLTNPSNAPQFLYGLPKSRRYSCAAWNDGSYARRARRQLAYAARISRASFCICRLLSSL